MSHHELAEILLEESGYTAMWQNDKSPDAPGRLENLRELVNAMAEFDTLAGFLEHVALVMELNEAGGADSVSLMTLHAAKGLEFDTVFLPGWEEGLFPSQRSLDESGLRALEEERRLAYVGLTRARRRAIVSFAANRLLHGSWSPAIPSRFVDELPKEQVEVESDTGLYRAGSGGFGFGRGTIFTSQASVLSDPEVVWFLVLVGAAFVAGLVDSIAGGGGLITVPAFLLAGLETHGLTPTPITAGWTDTLGEAHLESLWPAPGFEAERSNDHSVVLRSVGAGVEPSPCGLLSAMAGPASGETVPPPVFGVGLNSRLVGMPFTLVLGRVGVPMASGASSAAHSGSIAA